MKLNALFLNCTLKKSPETSNTAAFIENAEKIFKKLDVNTEVIRVSDFAIKFGTSCDEGEDDAWPIIMEKIKKPTSLLLLPQFGEEIEAQSPKWLQSEWIQLWKPIKRKTVNFSPIIKWVE